MSKLMISVGVLLLAGYVAAATRGQRSAEQEVERAVLDAARAAPQQDGESYQRVYEAFTKLMQNTANSSLGNVRRLVSRLNQLVGTPSQEQPAQPQPQPAQQQQLAQKEQAKRQQQSADENTEQILNRLDKVNKDTDQNTLRQLNDDVTRLISTLNDSYLRNIRRVIERVNKVVGQPEASEKPAGSALHQSGDRLDDLHQKQPGFPGWDEFIVAVDRMQKSFAHFVRSSTRLVTSG